MKSVVAVSAVAVAASAQRTWPLVDSVQSFFAQPTGFPLASGLQQGINRVRGIGQRFDSEIPTLVPGGLLSGGLLAGGQLGAELNTAVPRWSALSNLGGELSTAFPRAVKEGQQVVSGLDSRFSGLTGLAPTGWPIVSNIESQFEQPTAWPLQRLVNGADRFADNVEGQLPTNWPILNAFVDLPSRFTPSN